MKKKTETIHWYYETKSQQDEIKYRKYKENQSDKKEDTVIFRDKTSNKYYKLVTN